MSDRFSLVAPDISHYLDAILLNRVVNSLFTTSGLNLHKSAQSQELNVGQYAHTFVSLAQLSSYQKGVTNEDFRTGDLS